MASAANPAPKVLHVVLSLNPGGTERLVVELVTRLNGEFPTSVCCLDQVGAWGEDLRRDGLNVICLDRQPGFHPSLGHQIAVFARKHEVSVIHCHQYTPFVYGSLARLWSPSARVVFTEHGRLSDAPPSARRRLANIAFSRVPHRVFSVSQNLKQHMVAEGFPERKVGVIYNGIAIGPAPDEASRSRVRRELGIPDATFVVGTVARLDPVKDLRVLINAVSTLAQRQPSVLLIVGEGPERASLERVSSEHGVSGTVRFLGHRDDARDILAGCDAFANNSVSEGISLTILEAMAACLPVVATRVGGTPEILDDTCGVQVPARSADAMSAALARLAADPTLRQTLGRAARARVETRFTLERMVREYRDAYIRAASA